MPGAGAAVWSGGRVVVAVGDAGGAWVGVNGPPVKPVPVMVKESAKLPLDVRTNRALSRSAESVYCMKPAVSLRLLPSTATK